MDCEICGTPIRSPGEDGYQNIHMDFDVSVHYFSCSNCGQGYIATYELVDVSKDM